MGRFYLAAALAAALFQPVLAEMPIEEPEIDALAERALKSFETPGMTVGILKDGELVFAKGYGLADIENNIAVTPDTVFGIASHTKAYTTAALAMLMDEGKLSWDDKVLDHIPEFRLHEAFATAEFTLRDLLTHRSGLDLGAGDLLWFTQANATRADVIAALQHLKPVSSFRSKYDYDNLLYILAGEIVTRASGMPWEDFVETRIFQPLGMSSCRAMRERLPATLPVAKPYMTVDGKYTQTHFTNSEPGTAAASINCSLNDHAKWIALQLNEGRLKDGTALFTEARHREMWTPVTLMGASALKSGRYDQHFQAYGLGWVLTDAKGQLRVRHSGGLMGMVTFTNLLPEQEMAVMVFTNSMNGSAMASVSYEIMDAYLGVDSGDWISRFEANNKRAEMRAAKAALKAEKIRSQAGTPPQALSSYKGTYLDAWFGEATINEADGQLQLTFARSALLTGILEHFQRDTFVVRWNNRTLEADAYVRFTTDISGKVTGIKMQAVSEETDFSFDFHHLDLKRISD